MKKLGLLCALAGACSSDAPAATEVLVSVDGDADVLAQLREVRAFLYAVETTDEAVPARQWTFSWASERNPEVAVPPFSFGVVKGSGDHLRLVLKGYSARASSEPALIEQKLILSFRPRETVPVQAYLARPCLARASVCSGLGVTCWPSAHGGLQAGQCGPTPSNEFPRDPTPLLDGGGDAALDSQVADAGDASLLDDASPFGDADAQPPALPPERVSELPQGECAGPHVCTLAAYPCVPSASVGYSCQGQLADWPMPDALPGAKVAPSYDATSVPGLVLDQVTGLVWQRDLPMSYAGCTGSQLSAGDSCTWDEAKAYCAQLELGGRRWRLPSMIELVSILDETKSKPAIDPNVFPATPTDAEFWSASPNIQPGQGPWRVSFEESDTGSIAASKALRVRCVSSTLVRPGRPQDRYVPDAAKDVIRDSYTGLVWQRTVSPEPLTFETAKSYCSGLGEGFRLPALKELLTLVDPTRTTPAQSPHFATFPSSWFLWTASPRVGGVASGLFVSFTQGAVLSEDSVQQLIRLGVASATATQYHARCVR